MSKIAVWEFEGDAVFDGRNMYAEVAPRADRALRLGTLDFAFTPHDLSGGVVLSNGRPDRDRGTFALSLSGAGAVSLACSTGGVEPFAATTQNGFAAKGERIRVTLAWGLRSRVTIVNATRLAADPETRGAGFAAELPLRARIRVTPGAHFTFGAAHQGLAPYFHGQIHRVTLYDTVEEPKVHPPSATVHNFDAHRRRTAAPRRVILPGSRMDPVAKASGALDADGRSGVFVATADGERPIETIAVGDEVLTHDRGLQPVAWVGRVTLDWMTLRRRPQLRPIVIRKGALGDGLPEADLFLPPNHRLIATEGDHRMLLTAKTLAGLRGVYEADALGVGYTHLHCARSEIVLLNGVWVEAFNPTDPVRGGHYDIQRAELYDLFPALRERALKLVDRNADGS